MKTTGITIRTLCLLIFVISLAGCATIYSIKQDIPGLDRIIKSFSKAEVGPVKDENGDIIEGTQTLEEHTPQQVLIVEKAPQVEPNQTLAVTPTPSKTIEAVQNKPIIEKPKPISEIPAIIGGIVGKIKVLANAQSISPEGVIVRVNRVDGLPLKAKNELAVHNVDMEDKKYLPGNLVIRKGDKLNFINKDKIQHNVFSSSGENTFDLGTFGGGLQRSVKLNEEGVVKVYCNIHPGMATFVAVDDAGISQTIKNKEGSFQFSNLPLGDYILSLWSIRGEHTETFSITNSKAITLDIAFNINHSEVPKRLNKFGLPIKKRKIKREFY